MSPETNTNKIDEETQTKVSTETLEQQNSTDRLTKVTPLSKYLALVLFILLPFVGAYVGYKIALEEVVEEVEGVMIEEDTASGPEEKVEIGDEFVLNKGLVATTTVDMGKYKIRYDQSVLEVLNEKYEVVQTIDVNFAGLAGIANKESFLITNRDINYDHYLDLGVLSNVGYGGVNRFYRFYLYNPDNGLLELSNDFSTFEPDLSNLVNPTFDIENKSITSSAKSAQEWIYTEYIFDGEKYVKKESWSEGLDEERVMNFYCEKEGYTEKYKDKDVSYFLYFYEDDYYKKSTDLCYKNSVSGKYELLKTLDTSDYDLFNFSSIKLLASSSTKERIYLTSSPYEGQGYASLVVFDRTTEENVLTDTGFVMQSYPRKTLSSDNRYIVVFPKNNKYELFIYDLVLGKAVKIHEIDPNNFTYFYKDGYGDAEIRVNWINDTTVEIFAVSLNKLEQSKSNAIVEEEGTYLSYDNLRQTGDLIEAVVNVNELTF
ncbi:MAG: hypothetical protein R3B60_04245 [Candidatus Paceibacterota bacterium]